MLVHLDRAPDAVMANTRGTMKSGPAPFGGPLNIADPTTGYVVPLANFQPTMAWAPSHATRTAETTYIHAVSAVGGGARPRLAAPVVVVVIGSSSRCRCVEGAEQRVGPGVP